MFVDTEWVVSHLDDPSVCIVDCRKDRDYEQGHIPKSISLPITNLLKSSGLVCSYPSEAEVEALLGSKGITNDLAIIAYDDHDGVYSARLMWTLEVFGHDKMGMLDRNFSVYLAEGKSATVERGSRPPAVFRATLDPSKIATKEYVLEKIESDPGKTIDTRAVNEYVKGHVPKSINIPWTLNKGRDRNFRKVDELKDIFSRVGIADDDELIAYCNTGMTASHTYYALRRAGYKRVLLYPQSFSEWGTLPDLPKEYGS